MSTPTDQWRESEVLPFFCRHLVALCVTYQRLGGDQAGQELNFKAYAGTLICIRNAIGFLTAGHILRELEDALRSDQIDIQSAVLADTFGWRRISNHPIPFDLRNAPIFYIDDEEDGLDFGLVALHPYYVRLLASNGMVALGEENWIHQSAISFDAHWMLGLPAEFTSDRLPASGEGVVSPTMFRVQRLDSPPDGIIATRYPRFVGLIEGNLPLNSLAGMSGGPIFGFNYGPPMRYWIVALQSSWIRGRGIIFGCPIPVLASLLTEWANELLSAEDHETDDSHIS